MNRIEMIKSYGQEEAQKKVLADITKQINLFKAIAEIEWNWDRAKELIDTANACKLNGISMPNRFFKGDCGFVSFSSKSYEGGYDRLWIGGLSNVYLEDGKVICFGNSRDTEEKIMRFMKGFNEFESDFYAFVDETVKA